MNKRLEVLNIFRYVEMRKGHQVLLDLREVKTEMRLAGKSVRLISDRDVERNLCGLSDNGLLLRIDDDRSERANGKIYKITQKGLDHLIKRYK